ncbi:hypothetical protein MAR_032475 [Mya arenaria]|uniref:Uncharacterized protein n=1 Tax=Mya arenaria TaxID=6604 RepID=A0ABY7FA65_MYAAR|nr:hypothetical protein MAR_032475 [Mya arenaria]
MQKDCNNDETAKRLVEELLKMHGIVRYRICSPEIEKHARVEIQSGEACRMNSTSGTLGAFMIEDSRDLEHGGNINLSDGIDHLMSHGASPPLRLASSCEVEPHVHFTEVAVVEITTKYIRGVKASVANIKDVQNICTNGKELNAAKYSGMTQSEAIGNSCTHNNTQAHVLLNVDDGKVSFFKTLSSQHSTKVDSFDVYNIIRRLGFQVNN